MEDFAFILLEIDGSQELVPLDENDGTLLLNGERFTFEYFTRDGGDYVRLSDGREYRQLNLD